MTGHATSEGSRASVVAVVLAAGRATRMGAQKVLLDLSGRSLIQRVADAALGSRVTRTIVVLGHEHELVAEHLAGRPVTLVVNPDYEAGMSTSLKAGLLAAGVCDAAVVLLADQPFVTANLVDRLIDRFLATGASVVRPAVNGRPANPVLLSAALFPEIMAQHGDVGGREVVARHGAEVRLIAVEDSRLCTDIDSPADYESARCEA